MRDQPMTTTIVSKLLALAVADQLASQAEEADKSLRKARRQVTT